MPTPVHTIKCVAPYFQDVAEGKKTFELRKDDRGYEVGDILSMFEHVDGVATGRQIIVKITYVLRGTEAQSYGLQEGYCILGIK